MKMFRRVLNSSIIEVVNTLLHLMFGLSLAYFFGATPEMDSFVAASSFIIALNALFMNSQASAFIPFITKFKDIPIQKEIISSILQVNLILFVILAILIFFFSEWIALMIAPGLSAYQHGITTNVLKMLSVLILSSNFIAIGRAFLHYNLKFEAGYLIDLFQSIIVIALLFSFVQYLDIYSAPIASFIASFLIAGIYVFIFLKYGLKIKSSLGLINDFLKEYLLLLSPVMLSWLFIFSIRFSDMFVASFLSSGSLAYLSYCHKINLYSSIITSVVCSIHFPLLAKLSRLDDKTEFFNVFKQGLQVIFALSLGTSIFLYFFASEMIRVLFERGAFSTHDTESLVSVLRFYIFVFLCAPMGTFLTYAYYSHRRTGLATIYAIISASTNVILNIIFGYFMGIVGLALASSIAFIVGIALQISNISKINSYYKLLPLLNSFFGILVAGSLTAFLLYFVLKYITVSSTSIYFDLIYIILGLVLSASVYFGFTVLFKVEITKRFLEQKKNFKWRRK